LGLRRPQPGADPGADQGLGGFAAERDHRGPDPGAHGAVSAWKDVADGIRVRTSRLYAMNSLVATAGDHALLVDPGVLPSEIDDIAAEVRKTAPRLDHVSLAFTHPHWDHVLGLPWFPGATTLAHAGFADSLAVEAADVARKAEAALRE